MKGGEHRGKVEFFFSNAHVLLFQLLIKWVPKAQINRTKMKPPMFYMWKKKRKTKTQQNRQTKKKEEEEVAPNKKKTKILIIFKNICIECNQ